MHCLYFVGERKCYARSHEEFTRHWKSTLTEIAPKSPFFRVSRNPTRCGFRAGAKAIRYSMNKAFNYLVITNDFALRMFMRRKEGGFCQLLGNHHTPL